MDSRYGFKKGVASFYVVAFSTLILLIIAMSFATLVISQLERSSNEDLSQSAYDAALAGVEDARLAYEKYLNCKNNPSGENCDYVIGVMESDTRECSMVQTILSRPSAPGGEVMIKETSDGDNNMQQAYTCVKITTNPTEHHGEKSSAGVIFRPEFEEEGVLEGLESIEVNWPSEGVETISVAILQAPSSGFTLANFEEAENGYRSMVFLKKCVDACENSVGNGEEIQVGGTNDGTKQQLRLVNCEGPGTDGGCRVKISLPQLDGRSVFEVVVSSPEKLDLSDVTLKYFSRIYGNVTPAKIANQIVIDSTGRANDLFRRVRAVIGVEGALVSVMGPLELDNREH